MKEYHGENIKVLRFSYGNEDQNWQAVDRLVSEGFEIKAVTYGKTLADMAYTVILQRIGKNSSPSRPAKVKSAVGPRAN